MDYEYKGRTRITPRIAFLTLIIGAISKGSVWKEKYKKDAAMFLPIPQLQTSKIFSSEELSAILDAREYVKNIPTKIVDGNICFRSIYDLALYLEVYLSVSVSDNSLFVYHGHRDYRWQLVPSIYRRPEFVEEEIKETISRISEYLYSVPQLRRYTHLEILAIAQHYGAKTCFLDFTYNYKVAAAFACFEHIVGIEKQYGAIYYLLEEEAKLLAPCLDLPTGGIISLNLSDIPRIDLQQGLFFAAFNKTAFGNIINTDRYLFCHCIDSLTYPSDVNLTHSYLFPKEMHYPTTRKNESLEGRDDISKTLVAIESILRDWAGKIFGDMTWEDYYLIAQNYTRNSRNLNKHQIKRIMIFCRWFANLQKLPLPSHMTSIERLLWAIHTIEDYHEISYCSDDIINRTAYIADFSTIDQVKKLLVEARKEENYHPDDDGPYLFQ